MNKPIKRNALSTTHASPVVPIVDANLAQELAAGIGDAREAAPVTSFGGVPLLRLLRDGEFVYGAENIVVQEGSTWAINPMSIQHGWCCWINTDAKTKNRLAGEVMVPINRPLPPIPDPIEGTPFALQRSFGLRCLDGEDEGVEVLHKSTSIGGSRAIDKLLASIQIQLKTNYHYPCAMVQLESESYDHKKYGKIYNPLFVLVGWCGMDGTEMPPQEPEVDAPPPLPPKPTKPAAQARPPVQPKAPVEAVAEDPLPSAQTRQRRRPGR